MHRASAVPGCLIGLASLLPLGWSAEEVGRAVEPSIPQVQGHDPAALRLLQAADKLAEQKQWPDALREYVQLLDTAGGKLVPHPTEPGLLVPVRLLVHQRIAGLPSEFRDQYRRLVDRRAQQWFETGKRERDPRLLYRVVDEAFCCSVGAGALDCLGDLLFEQGRFAEAETAWAQVAPLPREHSVELVVADPKGDVARIRAKQLLARLFRERFADFESGLQTLASEHPDASGRLAGRQGAYVTLLRELARQWEPGPVPDAWTTFAGNARRDARLSSESAGMLRTSHRLEPQWKLAIAAQASPAPNPRPRQHPLFAEDKLIGVTDQGIVAVDLETGRRRIWYPPKESGTTLAANREPTSLTIAEGRLFACLETVDKDAKQAESWLVCLDHQEGRLLWKVPAAARDGPDARFQSAPLVSEDKVYVGVTSLPGENVTAIACYHATTGALRWRQDVCRGKLRKGTFHPALLTEAGRWIIYPAPHGVLAALDRDTGRIGWARVCSSPAARPEEQDLAGIAGNEPTPCLYSDGLLCVFTTADRRLRCLEAATGRLHWETAEMAVHQFLGVVGDRLLVTTNRDLRAIDVGTGEIRWRQPATGRVTTWGRGVIAGNVILWPTRTGWRAVEASTGEQVVEPQRLAPFPPGNLAPGGKRWAIVTENHWLFYRDRE